MMKDQFREKFLAKMPETMDEMRAMIIEIDMLASAYWVHGTMVITFSDGSNVIISDDDDNKQATVH